MVSNTHDCNIGSVGEPKNQCCSRSQTHREKTCTSGKIRAQRLGTLWSSVVLRVGLERLSTFMVFSADTTESVRDKMYLLENQNPTSPAPKTRPEKAG